VNRFNRVLIVFISLSFCACSNDDNKDVSSTNGKDVSALVANTSIAELQAGTDIPGKPVSVWWTTGVMGSVGDERVPGPTDYLLNALIDYGSADTVAEIVAAGDGYEVKVFGASWYPEKLTAQASDSEGLFQSLEYKNIPGFHPNATIRVPMGMPSYIVLRLVSGS